MLWYMPAERHRADLPPGRRCLRRVQDVRGRLGRRQRQLVVDRRSRLDDLPWQVHRRSAAVHRRPADGGPRRRAEVHHLADDRRLGRRGDDHPAVRQHVGVRIVRGRRTARPDSSAPSRSSWPGCRSGRGDETLRAQALPRQDQHAPVGQRHRGPVPARIGHLGQHRPLPRDRIVSVGAGDADVGEAPVATGDEDPPIGHLRVPAAERIDRRAGGRLEGAGGRIPDADVARKRLAVPREDFAAGEQVLVHA